MKDFAQFMSYIVLSLYHTLFYIRQSIRISLGLFSNENVDLTTLEK